MYVIIANPSNLEVHELVEDRKGKKELKIVKQLVVPQGTSVYRLGKVESIDNVNFEELINLMYSDDEDIRIIGLDTLDNLESLNKGG